MRAVIYLNWYSSESAAILPAQLAAANVAAGRGDLQLASPTITDASTDTTQDPSTRPGMTQIIAMVDQGFVNTVIVGSLDRLAQDDPNFLSIMQRLRGVTNCQILSGGGWDTISGDDGTGLTALHGGM